MRADWRWRSRIWWTAFRDREEAEKKEETEIPHHRANRGSRDQHCSVSSATSVVTYSVFLLFSALTWTSDESRVRIPNPAPGTLAPLTPAAAPQADRPRPHAARGYSRPRTQHQRAPRRPSH